MKVLLFNMRLNVFLQICFIFVSLGYHTQGIELNVENIRQCEHKQNLSIFLEKMTFKQVDEDSILMDGQVLIRETIPFGWVLRITMSDCEDGNRISTCNYFIKDFDVNNVCEKMEEKNTGWSDFLENLKMNKCPIETGLYTIDNLLIQASMKDYLFDSNTYLKFIFQGFYDGKEIGCILLDAEIIAEDT